MTKVLVTQSYLEGIASAIRTKLGVQTTYKPSQMAAAISSIVGAVLQSKTVTPSASDQTIQPDNGYNGLSSVLVSGDSDLVAGNIKKDVQIFGVTGSYEGSGGSPASLITKSITQNGTYYASSDNADGYSSVTVNVSGGASATVLSGTNEPASNTGSNGDIYIFYAGIPSNAQPVEYLQSDGTQYIDTGIIPDGDTGVEITFIAQGTTNIFGSRATNFTSNGLIVGRNTDKTNGTHVDYGGTRNNQSIESGTKLTCSCRTDTGVGYVGNKSFAITKKTYSDVNKSMLMFGWRNNTTDYKSPVTVFGCKIYDDGTIVACYVPVLDSNDVPCMYDTISGQYMYNDGTGTFSYGQQVNRTGEILGVYLKVNGSWVEINGQDISDANL